MKDDLKLRLEKFTELVSLSMNDCDLRSLENFPNLPKLVRLELVDNKLTGKSLNSLAQY